MKRVSYPGSDITTDRRPIFNGSTTIGFIPYRPWASARTSVTQTREAIHEDKGPYWSTRTNAFSLRYAGRNSENCIPYSSPFGCIRLDTQKHRLLATNGCVHSRSVGPTDAPPPSRYPLYHLYTAVESEMKPDPYPRQSARRVFGTPNRHIVINHPRVLSGKRSSTNGCDSFSIAFFEAGSWTSV